MRITIKHFLENRRKRILILFFTRYATFKVRESPADQDFQEGENPRNRILRFRISLNLS